MADTERAAATLHYAYDPLCGWCYAAAPLVAAVETLPGLSVRLHGGGLFPQPVSPDAGMRAYIRAADGRIAGLTGQPFGAAYLDGLLADPATSFHSLPPLAAILAAEEAAEGAGLRLLRAIQNAHYVEGRRVADPLVLETLATGCGLDGPTVAAGVPAEKLARHLGETRTLMARHGGNGFPFLLLERPEGARAVPVQGFLGRPDAFAQALAAALS